MQPKLLEVVIAVLFIICAADARLPSKSTKLPWEIAAPVAAKSGRIVFSTYDFESPVQNNSISSYNIATKQITPVALFTEMIDALSYAYCAHNRVYYLLVASPMSGTYLVGFNVDTGAFYSQVPISSQSLDELQCDPTTGTIYGVTMDSNNLFVSLDPNTGNIFKVGTFPNTYSLIGDTSAFDPIHKVYFAMTEDENSGPQLQIVDTIHKKARQLALSDDLVYMVFDSKAGRLLGNPSKGAGFVSVDLQTGNFTTLASTLPGIPNDGPVVDPNTGLLYLSIIDWHNETNLIVAIDLSTGKVVSTTVFSVPVRFFAYVTPN